MSIKYPGKSASDEMMVKISPHIHALWITVYADRLDHMPIFQPHFPVKMKMIGSSKANYMESY